MRRSLNKDTIFISLLVVGMLTGGIFGALVERPVSFVELLGDLFLSSLKMMIIPLVLSSVMIGVTSIGDFRKLGRLGAGTFVFYLSTTLIAVFIGLILVNLIAPGEGISVDESFSQQVAEYSFLDVVRKIVPSNLFAAMANGEILPMIFFALFAGLTLSTMNEKGAPLIAVVESVFVLSMKMVQIIVWAAPIGVFALVATRVGQAGGAVAFATEMRAVGYYSLTVILGLLVHALVVLSLIALVLGGRNPFRLMRQLARPLLLAFSTASSSATLPVTMETIEDKVGVDKSVGNFVLPLGATINMDGTALYEAVAAVFIAQCYGIELGATGQILVALTATLAAIGAAGIPQAGLVTLVMVLETAGLPAEGIGMLLAVDWFLDRCRTTVNVWGDSVGTVVLERIIFPNRGEALR